MTPATVEQRSKAIGRLLRGGTPKEVSETLNIALSTAYRMKSVVDRERSGRLFPVVQES